MRLTAIDHERRTIYHSPQTPGFTCWVGLWTMPDGSVMLQFTQATGPVQGWRPRTAVRLRGYYPLPNDGYDMAGLTLENIYLQSRDRGATWTRVSSDPFASVGNGCINGGTVLPSGHLLRTVWGQALSFWDVPQTGYLQRSTDGAHTWGPPELLCEDAQVLTWPKRVRVLRDGRIVVTGGVSRCPGEDWQWMDACATIRPCLWISDDDGRQWSPPIPLLAEGSEGYAAGLADTFTEEVDVAELPDGNLLAIYRLEKRHTCCLLAKQGNTWAPAQTAGPSSFPQTGHPELLVVREGALLYPTLGDTWWSTDGGAQWQTLPGVPGTGYYPRAVQLDDGAIMVVGHVGYDDAYGSRDQSIVMDTYQLALDEDTVIHAGNETS